MCSLLILNAHVMPKNSVDSSLALRMQPAKKADVFAAARQQVVLCNFMSFVRKLLRIQDIFITAGKVLFGTNQVAQQTRQRRAKPNAEHGESRNAPSPGRINRLAAIQANPHREHRHGALMLAANAEPLSDAPILRHNLHRTTISVGNGNLLPKKIVHAVKIGAVECIYMSRRFLKIRLNKKGGHAESAVERGGGRTFSLVGRNGCASECV